MDIIVDAFGGDNAPLEVIKGCRMAIDNLQVGIVLTGDEKAIKAAAQGNGISLDGMEIVHADSVFDIHEEPAEILKSGKGSSMEVGLRLLAADKGDAFVSAGSTGALVFGSTFIAKRIKGITNAYKVNIDDRTLDYFIETCGTSMLTLINEIRKLIEYAGENGTITTKDIDLLSIKELDSVIFDLTDSLGKKDIVNALQILKELLYNKEPIQKILITLYNHLKKIYLTMLADEYRVNIAEALNLKPNQMFLTTKYKKQASYFKKEELRNTLQALIDLDYKTKQGQLDINVGLEAILCMI